MDHSKRAGALAALLIVAGAAGCGGNKTAHGAFSGSSSTSSSVPTTSSSVPTTSSTQPSTSSAPTMTTTSAAPTTSSSVAPTTTSPPPTTTHSTAAPTTGGHSPSPFQTGGNAPAVGPIKISSSGDPKTWPDVCTFTNLAQLRALDPQITGLKGQPVGTKASVIGGGGGNTPRNTDCKFNLTTKFDTPDTASNPSWVEIDLTSVNEFVPSTFADAEKTSAKITYAKLPGGASCFYDGSMMQCIKGDIFYYINGIKNTGGENFQADQKKWLTEIMLPLATKLGGELSS